MEHPRRVTDEGFEEHTYEPETCQAPPSYYRWAVTHRRAWR